MKVSEVMTRRLVSVRAEDSVKNAAELMSERQVRRLPVEKDGKLVGMLSLGDLAKAPELSAEAGTALEGISDNIKYI